ncbi:MAG TPA: Gfo/Idh/MocA family oxidoreductase [Chryseosolibacter sp.]|nr:Gfo/Idh/MocA family oxidoreductase [Chryseosolibacter sp.]
MNRRKFIKNSSMATASLSAAPLLWGNSHKWKGANDRINVAVIGIRGMGQNHIQEYSKLKNVEVAALCDVDSNLFEPRMRNLFDDRKLRRPKTYQDLRKLYDDKDIDAVSIVIPNHWHALASIWAMQSGKHVSVEKPCCHNFYEGQKLVEAARKYKVVVQDGAEQRSNPCAQSAVEYMRAGKLGEVYMAKGVCYKWRDPIGNYPDGPMLPHEKFSLTHGGDKFEPPYTSEYLAKVNYDLWLGPASQRPFNRNRFHYNWHWHWDYGNGDMGNQGVHEMDVARWGLGVKLPVKISALGGHMMFEDAQQTPNVLMAMFEFAHPEGGGEKKKILQFEVRPWMTNPEGNHLGNAESQNNNYMTSSENVVGNIFYGSEGYMLKDVDHWQTFMGKKREPGESGRGLGNHFQNFADAIRANDPTMVTSPIEEGFYSCALIHLANISYRLGRTLHFDTETQTIKNDQEATRMLTREYREPYHIPRQV